MHTINLPFEYALVLHQVSAHGTEYFTSLAETLSFDRRRLVHILQALQSKRLITVTQSAHDAWISLSSRGQRLMLAIWPESQAQPAL